MNNEECIYCDTFSIFKELMLAGHSMEDAFHTVLVNFEEKVIAENFEDGYLSAMAFINEQTGKVIREILHDGQCECDETI